MGYKKKHRLEAELQKGNSVISKKQLFYGKRNG